MLAKFWVPVGSTMRTPPARTGEAVDTRRVVRMKRPCICMGVPPTSEHPRAGAGLPPATRSILPRPGFRVKDRRASDPARLQERERAVRVLQGEGLGARTDWNLRGLAEKREPVLARVRGDAAEDALAEEV